MNQQAIDRLQLKNPAEAIIERVQHDFNLAPLVARTLFDQMRSYFESYYQLKNDTGQLTYPQDVVLHKVVPPRALQKVIPPAR